MFIKQVFTKEEKIGFSQGFQVKLSTIPKEN